MGRDVTGIKSAKDFNATSNGVPFDCVYAPPMTLNKEVEPKRELIVDHSLKGSLNKEFHANTEVSTIENINIKAGAPDGGSGTTGAMKLTEEKLNVKPSPNTDASESIQTSPLKAQSQEVTEKTDFGISNANEVDISSTSNSPLPKEDDLPPVTDKIDSCISNASEVEIDSTSNNPLPKKNDLPSETVKLESAISNASEVQIDSTSSSLLPKKNDLPAVNAKTKKLHCPLRSGKSVQSDTDDDHHNEEDNCSLASSAGSSVRSTKFKITVPVGPKFVSDERIARRKELNRKKEEKQKALEAERREYEARLKAEEEGEIKLLRKSMSYRANPVPKFYQEGPPPKAKLKKLPLTRPKSPNLSRRKSCSDAFQSGPGGKRNLW